MSAKEKNTLAKERKIAGIRWFTAAAGTVGIVKVIDPCEGICYFISHVPGISEDADKEYVADWGARFPTDAGEKIFTHGWS